MPEKYWLALVSQVTNCYGKTVDAHVTDLKPYIFDMPTDPILSMEIPPSLPSAMPADDGNNEDGSENEFSE